MRAQSDSKPFLHRMQATKASAFQIEYLRKHMTTYPNTALTKEENIAREEMLAELPYTQAGETWYSAIASQRQGMHGS